MWGLDALTITFIAPHSLHARPLVVPRDEPGVRQADAEKLRRVLDLNVAGLAATLAAFAPAMREARRGTLVGIATHPLNRPLIDPESGLVVDGYGILQPRVSISLSSASRSAGGASGARGGHRSSTR